MPGTTASELDHLVPLELGGSNDIANLFPEKADAHPGYQVKDKLENKLHQMVCDKTMKLKDAQDAIRKDWVKAYNEYVKNAK